MQDVRGTRFEQMSPEERFLAAAELRGEQATHADWIEVQEVDARRQRQWAIAQQQPDHAFERELRRDPDRVDS